MLKNFYILQMYEIHKDVLKLKTAGGLTWNEICFKLPVVKIDSILEQGKRAKREINEDIDIFDQDDFFDIEE